MDVQVLKVVQCNFNLDFCCLHTVSLQLVRECKEVLKGGLLMKQYYQFMLREVLDDLQKNNCNIDSFEEDLHKMLMVRNNLLYLVMVQVC